MLFYLIRHGESLSNAEGRIQGQSDVALSPFGIQQSEAIADALANQKIDAIYSSPLRRAMQTAQPLARQLKLTIRSDDRLKEIHAGIFQGLLWSEIQQRYPAEAKPWIEQQADFVISGGESRRALMVRGQAVFAEIRQQPLRSVAVFSHGGLLAATLKALLEVPAENNPFGLFNGSISRMQWDSRVQLLTLNELDHLRASGLAREATGNL